MIGYLYAGLTVLAGITKGYCGKKTSGTIKGMRATILFNTVRMLICIPIGLVFVWRAAGLGGLAVTPAELLISAVSGVSTAAFVVLWLICVRRGAYMMAEVFITLGVAVPVALSAMLFAEPLRINHVIGMILLVLAAYILYTYDKALHAAKEPEQPQPKKKSVSAVTVAVLCLSGLANGVTLFAQKWFRQESSADVSVFNLYTYVFAAAALAVCYAVSRRAEPEREEISKEDLKRLGIYVCVMSLCIFLYSYFSVTAAGYLPSYQLYPLLQGMSLVLSLLMSAVCFGEKITVRSVIGIAVTFAALICINLL